MDFCDQSVVGSLAGEAMLTGDASDEGNPGFYANYKAVIETSNYLKPF